MGCTCKHKGAKAYTVVLSAGLKYKGNGVGGQFTAVYTDWIHPSLVLALQSSPDCKLLMSRTAGRGIFRTPSPYLEYHITRKVFIIHKKYKVVGTTVLHVEEVGETGENPQHANFLQRKESVIPGSHSLTNNGTPSWAHANVSTSYLRKKQKNL